MSLLVIVLPFERYDMLDSLEALAWGPRWEHGNAPSEPKESCSYHARAVKVFLNFNFVLRWHPRALGDLHW